MTLIILNTNTKFTDNLRIPIYIITGQITVFKKKLHPLQLNADNSHFILVKKNRKYTKSIVYKF